MALFYPELTLGADALSANRRRELGAFLVDVVRQRGFPMHVANLWNALYFGWDVEQRRYVAATIESARIPQRTMNERDDPLPVGAFVRVATRTQAGDLWAEVIYKEGAHPEVTADQVPPSLCGSPGELVEIDGRPAVVLTERLVLDIGAFENTITPAAYERLLRNARWLDERGHLVMGAVYEAGDAELEDTDLYINYLLDRHRDGLLAFCFREEPTEEELREALIRSFTAVRDLAHDCRELASWRQKLFFDAEAYHDRIGDQGPFPLGAGDLDHLFLGLTRIPSNRRVSYVAVGPRLDDLFSCGGYDQEERAWMCGQAYATAMVYTNRFIRDRLEADAQEGLLDGNLHLRLDDDWLAGGIWRCERVDGPNSITRLPSDLPLHLGRGESEGPVDVESSDDAEPEATTVHGFTVPLTARDIASGRLRLPGRVVDQLPTSGPVALRLRHDGEQVDQDVPLERDAGEVGGVPWPPSLFPGIKLHGNVERGGSVIKVRTERLLDPRAIDGVELQYEFVESVYRRETDGRELSRSERRGALTVNELIVRAFRRYGRDAEGGGKALSYLQLVRAVLGPSARASESQALAHALESMELTRDGAAFVWRPRITRRTSVSDRSTLAAYGEEATRQRLRRIVRRHYVPMYLRHMQQRGVSVEKIESYAEARLTYGMQGLLPAELPEGYTWVEPHERGTDDAADAVEDENGTPPSTQQGHLFRHDRGPDPTTSAPRAGP
jgi:hypothetical protein